MAYSTLLLISCLVLYNTISGQSQNQSNVNLIDSCLLSKPNWASNPHSLADCAVGFGKNSLGGGKNGKIYVVTDPSDEDHANPKPGTLRQAVAQKDIPLWITFVGDMVISLKTRLLISSYKTIDGRGARIEINGDGIGPCLQVDRATHVIVHGISIRGCNRSTEKFDSGGDGITVFGSSNIWIDHCSFSECVDGLIDVIRGSTNITISNNYFSNQDKVMLLGNNDLNDDDKNMRVTVVFNYFGPGLVQRMPRVRLGYAHVANNRYEKWKNYAIGGSGNPTIFSEGNYYTAPEMPFAKEVTRRLAAAGGGWRNWTWKSSGDVFRNGAFFIESGILGNYHPNYSPSQTFTVARANLVPALTSTAGPFIFN